MFKAALRTPLIVIAVVLVLSGAGCTPDPPTQPHSPGARSDSPATDAKTQPPGTDWAGRARPFADNIRIHSLAVTPTHLFATTLYEAEKLIQFDELGHPVTFAPDFSAPEAARCYVDVSPGWNAQLPADEVWVSLGRTLVRLSPQGGVLPSAASLAAGYGDIAGLCFDDVGTFEHVLLVLSESGHVFRLPSATTSLSLVGFIGAGACAPSVASLQMGTHAGQLLVTFPDEHVVRALSPSGITSDVVGWSGVSSAQAVPPIVREFGRSRGAYFVALDNRKLYRFEAADIAPLQGELLVSSLHRSGSGVVTPQGVGYRSRAFSRFWGPEVCTAVVRRPAVTSIELSVQNGTVPPTFVQGSTTILPVTLLSSPWFTPSLVDVSSVNLAAAPPVPYGKSGLTSWGDRNEDGVTDLTLYFRPVDMQIGTGDITLTLLGETMASEAFRGTTDVVVSAP